MKKEELECIENMSNLARIAYKINDLKLNVEDVVRDAKSHIKKENKRIKENLDYLKGKEKSFKDDILSYLNSIEVKNKKIRDRAIKLSLNNDKDKAVKELSKISDHLLHDRVTYSSSKDFKIDNIKKIPYEFLMVDDKKVNEYLKNNEMPHISGIKIVECVKLRISKKG